MVYNVNGMMFIQLLVMQGFNLMFKKFNIDFGLWFYVAISLLFCFVVVYPIYLLMPKPSENSFLTPFRYNIYYSKNEPDKCLATMLDSQSMDRLIDDAINYFTLKPSCDAYKKSNIVTNTYFIDDNEYQKLMIRQKEFKLKFLMYCLNIDKSHHRSCTIINDTIILPNTMTVKLSQFNDLLNEFKDKHNARF